jgi:sterol desaturase/sphingolipid hydroxylase (fatty acid hydroxylase superfamily)
MIDSISNLFNVALTGLFESVVQPFLFVTGMAHLAEPAYDATFWVLLGIIEIALLAIVLGTAEKLKPAEPVTDRQTIRTDIFYTVLHRLGAFGLIVFALMQPLMDTAKSQLTLWGWQPFQVELVWSGVTDIAWVSFLIYLLILDFFDYWIHRAQHRWQWWWELHALHHSQRQMTLWSDNRNHLLDDLLRDALFAVLALFIGVAPAQFVGLIVLSRVVQSLQHANIRLQFTPLLETHLVSPSFHRLHHAIGAGHEGKTFGCNFGVIFSFWDRLFKTADFSPGFVPTGVRDQLSGRDYGSSFWEHQKLGVVRLYQQLFNRKIR